MLSDRARRRAGWCVATAAVLLLATVPFSWSGGVAMRPGVTHGTTGQGWAAVLAIASFTFSGAALIQARPRNAIGWTLPAPGPAPPPEGRARGRRGPAGGTPDPPRGGRAPGRGPPPTGRFRSGWPRC